MVYIYCPMNFMPCFIVLSLLMTIDDVLAYSMIQVSSGNTQFDLVFFAPDDYEAQFESQNYTGLIPLDCKPMEQAIVMTGSTKKPLGCIDIHLIDNCANALDCMNFVFALGPFQFANFDSSSQNIMKDEGVFIVIDPNFDSDLPKGIRLVMSDSEQRLNSLRNCSPSEDTSNHSMFYDLATDLCKKFDLSGSRTFSLDKSSWQSKDDHPYDIADNSKFIMVKVYDNIVYSSDEKSHLRFVTLGVDDGTSSFDSKVSNDYKNFWLMSQKHYKSSFGPEYDRRSGAVYDSSSRSSYSFNAIRLWDPDFVLYFNPSTHKKQFFRIVEILGADEKEVIQEFAYEANYWIFTVKDNQDDYYIYKCQDQEVVIANSFCLKYRSYLIDEWRSFALFQPGHQNKPHQMKGLQNVVNILSDCATNEAAFYDKVGNFICVPADDDSVNKVGIPLPSVEKVEARYELAWEIKEPHSAEFYNIFDGDVSNCEVGTFYFDEDSKCFKGNYMIPVKLKDSLVSEVVLANYSKETEIVISKNDRCNDDHLKYQRDCVKSESIFDNNSEGLMGSFFKEVNVNDKKYKMRIEVPDIHKFEVYQEDSLPDDFDCSFYEVKIDGNCKHVHPSRSVNVYGTIGFVLLQTNTLANRFDDKYILDEDIHCKILVEVDLEGKCIPIDNDLIELIDLPNLDGNDQIYGVYAANVKSALTGQDFLLPISKNEANNKLKLIVENRSKIFNSCYEERTIQDGKDMPCRSAPFVTEGLSSEGEVFYVAHHHMSSLIIEDYACEIHQVYMKNTNECVDVNFNLMETNIDHNPENLNIVYLLTKSEVLDQNQILSNGETIKVPKSHSNVTIVFHTSSNLTFPLLGCDFGEIFINERCRPVSYEHRVTLDHQMAEATLYSKNISPIFVERTLAPCRNLQVYIEIKGSTEHNRCIEANIVYDLPLDFNAIQLYGKFVQTMTNVDGEMMSVFSDLESANEIRIMNLNYDQPKCRKGHSADSRCMKLYFYEDSFFKDSVEPYRYFTPFFTHKATSSAEFACGPNKVLSKAAFHRCLDVINTVEKRSDHNLFYEGEFLMKSFDERKRFFDVSVREKYSEFAVIHHKKYNEESKMCSIGQVRIGEDCRNAHFRRNSYPYEIYTAYPTKQIISRSPQRCMEGQIFDVTSIQCHPLIYLIDNESDVVSDMMSSITIIPVKSNVKIDGIVHDVRVAKEYATKFIVTKSSHDYLIPLANCIDNQISINSTCHDVFYFEKPINPSRSYMKFTQTPTNDAILIDGVPCPPGFIRYIDVEPIIRNCLASVDSPRILHQIFPNYDKSLQNRLNDDNRVRFDGQDLKVLLWVLCLASSLIVMCVGLLITNCVYNSKRSN